MTEHGLNFDRINSDKVLKTVLDYLTNVVNAPGRSEMVRLLSCLSRDIVNADRCSLWFIDNERQELYAKVADGVDEIRVPVNSGCVGYAITNDRPLISNDPYNDERFMKIIDTRTGYKTKSLLVVPVKNKEKDIVGAFEVLNKKGDTGFNENDLLFLSLSVSVTGMVLDSFNTHDILKTIFTFATRIADEPNIDKLLLLLADLARDILDSDRCSLWLVDKERNELWTKAAHGLNSVRIPLHSGFVGNSVINNNPVICNDVYNDSRFNPDVDKVTGYETKCLIAVPIKNMQNDVIGAIECVNKRSYVQNYREPDVEKLELVGGYAAQMLEVTGLYKEIEDTQKEIVFTLGTACEFRSRETSNHVKRVAEYSRLLALLYGLELDEVELVKQASPMHDVGKIAIPDSILNKPEKLTPEEFDVMKTHTEIGYNMLSFSKRKILKAATIIASEHHEKWNGSGYPKGKKGDDIHIYGRISALADVFDALGSDRCYKKAWELDRILDFFRDERGRHFEPKLMDIFFENLKAFLMIRDKYDDVK